MLCRFRLIELIVVGCFCFFFFQAEDGIRDRNVTGVQTCALPISIESEGWRRERDSNPRYRFRFSGFQDHRHRPLGHPSAANKTAQNVETTRFSASRSCGLILPYFARFSRTVVTTGVTAYASSASPASAPRYVVSRFTSAIFKPAGNRK